MTKQEYEQAKEKASKYQALDFELTKVNGALDNIKKYSLLVIDSNTTGYREAFGITTQIRDDLVTLLQGYKDSIVAQMEAL